MKKILIRVDHPQQKIEKNQNWQDYPCRFYPTNRRCKKSLGYYFENWEAYLSQNLPKNLK